MEWMLLPLRRYAVFRGRSRPREYWMFFLFLLIGFVLLSFVDAALGLGGSTRWVDRSAYGVSAGFRNSGGVLTSLFLLGTIIPHLAVAVRRLHDINRRGWWLLVALVPFIGWLVLLIFLVSGGTRGPNRFGPDPFDSEIAEPR